MKLYKIYIGLAVLFSFVLISCPREAPNGPVINKTNTPPAFASVLSNAVKFSYPGIHWVSDKMISGHLNPGGYTYITVYAHDNDDDQMFYDFIVRNNNAVILYDPISSSAFLRAFNNTNTIHVIIRVRDEHGIYSPAPIEIPIAVKNQPFTNDTTRTGDYYLSGNIYVNNNILISNNSSLTIQPGTTITFGQQKGIILKGQNIVFNCVGLEDYPIRLKQGYPSATNWSGIQVLATNVVMDMRHTLIEHAIVGFNYSNAQTVTMTFESNDIINCSRWAVSGNGNGILRANCFSNNMCFTDNLDYGSNANSSQYRNINKRTSLASNRRIFSGFGTF